MRRNLFLILAGLGLFFSTLAHAGPRIKIGVSLPLSGGAAGEGKDLQQILKFANENLANDAYDFVFEDDKCSNKDAVTIAQKFVSIDKVRYVLGYACSGAFLAAAPIFEKAGVVAFGLATGAPEISAAGEHIFRTIPSLEVAGQGLAGHAAKRFKRIAIFSEETAYCQGLADAFERHNTTGTLKVERISYLPDTADFRSFFLKLSSQGNEAIFLNPQDEQGMIRLYRQFLESGWKVPVYAAYYPGFTEFKKIFGEKADGIVFADLPFIDSTLNQKSAPLYEKYIQEHGRPQSSEFYFVTGLAAFDALHAAISSKEDISHFLYSHHFSGMFGEYRFDANGDVVGDKLSFVLKTLRGGSPTLEGD